MIVFFIILVANVGGALTPLGDPPLFVGFLRGVDFFWPRHLWLQTAIVAALVLAMFCASTGGCFAARKSSEPPMRSRLRVRGTINLALIALIIAAILLSAVWKPGVVHDLRYAARAAEHRARRRARSSSRSPRCGSRRTSIAPPTASPGSRSRGRQTVRRHLRRHHSGAGDAAGRARGTFALLLAAVTANDGQPHQVAYFWLTGLLSAFLDNAPTYLVFFELAGGDARALMGPLAGTLAAISMGAVYMGALTYIGNAPNFMVYAIAEERGIRMPSFFGYFAWASLC